MLICAGVYVRELKDHTHRQAALQRGRQAASLYRSCIMFTSFGRMHERTEKWLKLDDMALDERLLQRICSGRRQFVARVLDGVSCALILARGDARILIFKDMCAELVSRAELARAKLRAELQRAPPGQDGRGDWEGLAP